MTVGAPPRPGFHGIAGLRYPPVGTRARMMPAAPEGAILNSSDPLTPVDLWLSDYRDDYFSGRYRIAAVGLNLKNTCLFWGWSLVPVPTAEQGARRRANFEALLIALRNEFYHAVVRALGERQGLSDAALRRIRRGFNARHGRAPDPGIVAARFENHPEAVVAGKGILKLYNEAAKAAEEAEAANA